LNPIFSAKQSSSQRKFSSLQQKNFTSHNHRTFYNRNTSFLNQHLRTLSTVNPSKNEGSSLLWILLGLFGFGVLSTNEASAQSDLNDTEERLYDRVMDALADGDYAKARGFVTERLEKEPSCRAGLYIQGFLLMQQGRYQEALQAFDSVIVISPDWADTYSKRAECLMALGRLRDALRTLNYVIRRFPSWNEPKYLKVETLLRLKKADSAEKILDDLLKNGSWTQQGLYLKSAMCFANSNYAEAFHYADEAVHLNNRFVDALVLKGLCLDALEYHDAAEQIFSKALEPADARDTALVTKPQAIGQVLNNLVGLMTTLDQEAKATQCRQKLTERWLAMVATKE